MRNGANNLLKYCNQFLTQNKNARIINKLDFNKVEKRNLWRDFFKLSYVGFFKKSAYVNVF